VAARTSIRVRGVTYRSPDDAYVAAAELEDRAETIAGNLRRDGNDAEAEQVSDRARADAERLRAFAREREEHAAAATAQPPDAPPPTSSSSSGSQGKGARGRSSTRGRSSSSSPRRPARRGSSSGRAFTPRTRSIVVGTGIPRATSSATSLALQVLGLTLGVAFLTLLLTDRGVSAFGDLAGGIGNGLRWLLDPVDPLAPRPKPTATASATATANARTVPAARTVTVAPLAVGVG
jgi:hypothetical protein